MGKFNCSVIIVAYNCWDHVISCVASLSRQTVTPTEVCILNNGEAPNKDQAREISSCKMARIIDAGKNIGFAAGCNLAAANSAGSEWLIFLNPDTCLEPEWIETMQKAVKDNPKCVSFGSRLVNACNIELLDGDGDAYHFSGLAWRQNFGKPNHPTDQYKRIFSPCAAASMFHREVYEKLGGFDEDFFCYLEDVDLGFRLLLLGFYSINVNSCPVLHQGSAISGYRSEFYTYYGQRNLIFLFAKNVPFPLVIILLPFHILMNFLGVFKCAMRGLGITAFRAKLDAIRFLPKVIKKRSAIQRDRQLTQVDLWMAFDRNIFLLFARLLK